VELLGKIVEFLARVSPRTAVTLFLLSLALLLVPKSAATWLDLESLAKEHRTLLSLTVLASGAYLVTYLPHAAWKRCAPYRKRRAVKKRLHSLTHEEKKLLQSYVHSYTRTRRWAAGSGVVGGLVLGGILFCASNIGSREEGFAYNIHDWVLEYLRSHQGLISTPGDTTQPDAFA
jgi:hypothetical protein